MSDSRVNQPILWTQALSKQVNTGDQQLTILQNIELQVNPGEAVAIIGASGSGKSTLLGLLAGLDLPTSGKVHLDAVDIFTLDEDSRAALRGRVLGFVFQSFQLLPALTALENVMLPLELAAAGDAEATAHRLLERVGLGKRLHHYPKQLSGGEQQRVAIARAFATAPKLLLADEPTGNLDSATGIQIIELMFELNREHGTTLVLVTHDEALSRRCSRQIRLADGKVVQ
ncbi:MAG: ATP-binding cassette domain-containing protein [Proteobacteria bacterium]|jgi:putative ABC transport system ATP-binding protein|nr:ATP-binding cassette domain-containing protein [Pseudomonadota bacterium]